jgi:hypothetical protein
LPDGESGIFFARGLDRVLGDLPGGLFCRMPGREIVLAREAKQLASRNMSLMASSG